MIMEGFGSVLIKDVLSGSWFLAGGARRRGRRGSSDDDRGIPCAIGGLAGISRDPYEGQLAVLLGI